MDDDIDGAKKISKIQSEKTESKRGRPAKEGVRFKDENEEYDHKKEKKDKEEKLSKRKRKEDEE